MCGLLLEHRLLELLARIFHTDRDKRATKADGARRLVKAEDGCVNRLPVKGSELELSIHLTRIFHTDSAAACEHLMDTASALNCSSGSMKYPG
jgi:hypothetical protein